MVVFIGFMLTLWWLFSIGWISVRWGAFGYLYTINFQVDRKNILIVCEKCGPPSGVSQPKS